jgi:hypothetical protein
MLTEFSDEEKRAAKARTTEEKAAMRQEQEAEKEKKAEEKRMQQENRKSKELSSPTSDETRRNVFTPWQKMKSPTEPRGEEHYPAVTDNDNDDLYRDPTPAGQPAQSSDPESGSVTSPTSPTSPTKSDGKGFKGFLKKFKRRSKHSAAAAETDKPGFIGGAALRGSSSHSNSNRNGNDSVPSSPHPAPALASNSDGHYSDVSSISTDANGDRGRAPKRTASGVSVVSGTSDYSEARDAFDPDVKLPPPPVFGSTDAAAGRKGSPNRDSRFTEIGI